MEQYKFGLPTLLIATEQGIYAATKCKIDQVIIRWKKDEDTNPAVCSCA